MTALVATTPTVTGVVDVGAAVSASDTIDQSILGGRGAYLDITNVTNNANVEVSQPNYDFTRRASLTGLPIIPSFGIRAEF